jgi:MFS family permease
VKSVQHLETFSPPATRGGALTVVTTAFSAIMATPNLPTPLLPGYRRALGLSAFGLTVLFSVYLVVLVVVLLSVGRLSRRYSPRALLLTGIALAAAADGCLGPGAHLIPVLAGRALTGAAVGASTGAAAVLLAHHGGGRERSATALCALGGAAAGTAAAALAADFLPWPNTTIYLLHLLILLASAVGIVVVPVGVQGAAIGRRPRGRTSPRARGRGTFVIGSAVGAAAWITAGLVVSLVPTYSNELLGATDRVTSSSPVVGFLLAACAGARLGARRPARVELPVALILMCGGLAGVAVSGPLHSALLLFIAGGITGGGQGLGFRAGLATAVGGSDTARHGRVTVLYNAFAYLGATVTTLTLGVAATAGGLETAFRYAAVIFAGYGVVLIVFAARLRVEPADA